MKQEQIDKLPLYDVPIDEDEIYGIYRIAIVDKPAIVLEGVYYSSSKSANVHENCRCIIDGDKFIIQEDEKTCELCREARANFNKGESFKFRAVEEEGVLLGPILIPNTPIVKRLETSGQLVRANYRPEVIEFYAERMMKQGLEKFNFLHEEKEVPCFLKEVWIKKDQTKDKSSLYGYESAPIGTLFTSVKFEDMNFFKEYVKNGYNSFSIEAIFPQFQEIKYNQEEELFKEMAIFIKNNEKELEEFLKNK